MSSELDQSGLLCMHQQPEPLQALAHLGQESLGVVQALAANNTVVGEANGGHVPASVAVSPLLCPQVEDVFIRGPSVASPLLTQGGSPVRESRTPGSVRGVPSNGHPYRVNR